MYPCPPQIQIENAHPIPLRRRIIPRQHGVYFARPRPIDMQSFSGSDNSRSSNNSRSSYTSRSSRTSRSSCYSTPPSSTSKTPPIQDRRAYPQAKPIRSRLPLHRGMRILPTRGAGWPSHGTRPSGGRTVTVPARKTTAAHDVGVCTLPRIAGAASGRHPKTS